MPLGIRRLRRRGQAQFPPTRGGSSETGKLLRLDTSNFAPSAETEDCEERFVDRPQFFLGEVAGCSSETLRVDGTDVFYEHSG
jgi:hypothetical protein